MFLYLKTEIYKYIVLLKIQMFEEHNKTTRGKK